MISRSANPVTVGVVTAQATLVRRRQQLLLLRGMGLEKMTRFLRAMDNATVVIIMFRAPLSKKRTVAFASSRKEIFYTANKLTPLIQKNVNSAKKTTMLIQKINAQFVHQLTWNLKAVKDVNNLSASNAWTVMHLALMVGVLSAQ